jgi:hypothetical protein
LWISFVSSSSSSCARKDYVVQVLIRNSFVESEMDIKNTELWLKLHPRTQNSEHHVQYAEQFVSTTSIFLFIDSFLPFLVGTGIGHPQMLGIGIVARGLRGHDKTCRAALGRLPKPERISPFLDL